MEVAAVASIAGTALTAYGQRQQGKYAAAQGRYNQTAANLEAEGLDIQAGQAVAEGTHAQARIAQRAEEIMAMQIARGAAGGGSADDATVQAFVAETKERSMLDMMIAQAEADERGSQLNHQADVRRAGGRIARWQGDRANSASKLAAGATLLNGAGSWAQTYGGFGGGGNSSFTFKQNGGNKLGRVA